MEIQDLKALLKERILVLDGAMGTMIQREGLTENDFRGNRFASHPDKLLGCNDLLCLTRPDLIARIHMQYVDAGADIISTDTFNSNSISMQDYGLTSIPGLVREINVAGASVARKVADKAMANGAGRRVLVAGSMGPTNRTASMSPDVADPSARNVDYDELFEAYREQAEGLIEGGADILLFETVFDTLNLKAGLDAANHVMAVRGKTVPVMVSATISDKSGRTLSGQTIAAFVTSVGEYGNVVTLGLNCGFGPSGIIPYLRELVAATGKFVSCHPNAGLPDELGQYKETPEIFSSHVEVMLRERLVNIAGGCCGTTPAHIAALAAKVRESLPHIPVEVPARFRVAGLDMVEVTPDDRFLNVGERCNVAGSRKFLRLIKEKNYEEAMRIARRQVEDGAKVIDVNMDDSLLDAREEMVRFLRYISSDPDIAKVPVMVDSSQWDVVEAALKNLQGKSIVNSISLKEGEEKFLARARRIRSLGAAVIVMAFDEQGQADTYERKIEICGRAYRLLTEECGFESTDIIFDVNIMAVATGIEAHDRYGLDFIRAVEWVKGNLPGALTSGGVSNLSFSFRGKNFLREAMHTVFLFHAVAAGLDMGIVNPASTLAYDDIEPGLRTLLEDVILCRRKGASEELAAYAMKDNWQETHAPHSDPAARRDIPVAQRLETAIVRGDSEFLAADLDEAYAMMRSAVKIVEGPLMDGMNKVGELFGEGKMFLPQVVKTARTMKQAVDHLKPIMEAEAGNRSDAVKAGKILFATVKGDVHDIGKNIASIVLSCNNFEVIDLGVMVPAEVIVRAVREQRPDIVCLSGLITPSLSEMVNVARLFEEEGINIPILVGGATTSRLHTALKIAPVYGGVVAHMTDAAQNPVAAAALINPATGKKYAAGLREEYCRLREEYENEHVAFVPLAEARKRGKGIDWKDYEATVPAVDLDTPLEIGLDLSEIEPFINWKMFFHAWGVPEESAERTKLMEDAFRMLATVKENGMFDGKGMVSFHRASSASDVVTIGSIALPVLRQQREGSAFLSISDFIAPEGKGDIAGVFAVTAGKGIMDESARLKEAGDSYGALLLQSLADRIAEAASEWLHMHVRRKYWGYAPAESASPEELLKGNYQGIRPAMGYPMLPDQLLNKMLSRLLPLERIGVEMTENGAMSPSATVSGLYISHPESRYFMVGRIADDQLREYAERRAMPEDRIRDILRN